MRWIAAASMWSAWSRSECGNAPGSKIHRRVVDYFLHHEKSSRLPHARQRDQFLAMDAVEIRHVADPDLQKIVEVARHQMAVEHEFEFGDRLFKVGKALRRGAVEHYADH